MARYRVRQGDTIESIARRAGISREEFIRLNPGLNKRWEIELAAQEGWVVRLGEGNKIGTAAGQDTTLAYVEIAGGDYSRGDVRPTYASQSPILVDDEPPSPWQPWMQEEADASVERSRSDEYVDMMQEYVPGYTGYVPGSPEDARAREEHGFPPYEEATAAGDSTPKVPQTDVSGDTADSDAAGGPAAEAVEAEGMSEAEVQNAYQMAVAAFPWIESLGLGDQILGWIREGYNGSALVGLIRQTDAWIGMFPGIRRDDGTLRMNEGTYMSTMDGYRRILQQFYGGDLAAEYSNAELSEFLTREIDARELGDRLRVYDQVVRGGSDVRNAFYVYAGISMSDDDLYNYVVDPFTQQEFDAAYSSAAMPTYEEFIGRAVDIVTESTGASIPRDQAAQTLDLLYHGGDPGAGDYLSLNELVNAFELAMIGSTATFQGLELPDLEHLQQLRMAGVSRTQALHTYGQYAQDRNFINAIVARAGGDEFTQQEYTSAELLNTPTESLELRRARQQETARAKPGGFFNFGRERGRMAQSGFAPYRT